MKLKGFTLAELMTTLAIVGLLATLTIPVITHNIRKHHQQALLRKGIQTLNEAISINIAKGRGDLLTYRTKESHAAGIPEYLTENIDTATGVKTTNVKTDAHENYAANSLYFETKDGVRFIFPSTDDRFTPGALEENRIVCGSNFDGDNTVCPVLIDTNKNARNFDHLPPTPECTNDMQQCDAGNGEHGVYGVGLTNNSVFVPDSVRRFLGDIE